jgi:hypothetical protein
MRPPAWDCKLRRMGAAVLALSTRALPPRRPAWPPCRSASPGRLQAFDDLLARFGGEGSENPVVGAVHLCLVEGQRVVGAAFLETGTKWVQARH